jgi:hypothetical protein
MVVLDRDDLDPIFDFFYEYPEITIKKDFIWSNNYIDKYRIVQIFIYIH